MHESKFTEVLLYKLQRSDVNDDIFFTLIDSFVEDDFKKRKDEHKKKTETDAETNIYKYG